MSALSHILRKPLLSPHSTRSRSALAWASRYWAVVAYWLLSAGLVSWIAWEASTSRLITFSQGADFWEHSAALRALIAAPFAPGNPHLQSDALSPRYNPIYLVVALGARALGLDALGAMALAATLHLSLFAIGVFWFFASYFRDLRAPLYAFFVLFLSWWRGWHFSNVYQLQILPSVAAYPSTAALGLSWFCFASALLVLRAGTSLWRLTLLALLSCLVLLVHPLTAALAFTGVLGLALLEPGASRQVRAALLLAVAAGALAAHLWPYYSAFDVLSGGRHPTTAGWVQRAAAEAVSDGGPRRPNQLFYDLGNLRAAVGLAAPGLLGAAVLLWQRKHLFIPAGLLAMLAVYGANTVVKLPLGHRFVLLAMVFLHLATVWCCLRYTPGYRDASPWLARRWPARIAPVLLMAVFAVGAWHNVQLASSRVRQAQTRRLSPIVNYARQAARRAGDHAVILGRAADTWPVPTFGAKVVALLHINPLVPDGRERESDVRRFFAWNTPDPEREAILHRYAATHVLVNGRELKAVRSFLEQRGTGQRLAGGYRLYALGRN